jgi:hypothetical protein
MSPLRGLLTKSVNGTSPTSGDVRLGPVNWAEADIGSVSLTRPLYHCTPSRSHREGNLATRGTP